MVMVHQSWWLLSSRIFGVICDCSGAFVDIVIMIPVISNNVSSNSLDGVNSNGDDGDGANSFGSDGADSFDNIDDTTAGSIFRDSNDTCGDCGRTNLAGTLLISI